MSDPEDNREFLNEIKALEDVLIANEESSKGSILQNDKLRCNPPIVRRANLPPRGFGEVESESEIIEAIDIKNLHSAYETNLRLIEVLRETKKELETILEKCEENKSIIDEKMNLRGSTTKNSKVFVCTAGMPYFKDAKQYPAPVNNDVKIKKKNAELHVLQLRYTSGWTPRDRNILWRAIRQEGAAAILEGKRIVQNRARRTITTVNGDNDNDDDDEDDGDEQNDDANDGKGNDKAQSSKPITLHLPKDFKAMIGPPGAREFDWMKISTIDFEGKHTADECRVMWRIFLHPDINRSKWTKEEDAMIEKLSKKYNYQDWETLAEELNNKRSGYQCFIRFNSINHAPFERENPWLKPEDDKLRLAVTKLKIGHYIPWGLVGRYMTGRTKGQVYYRWTYNSAPHLKKGRFTEEEDRKLLQGLKKYGRNFSKISSCVMPNRSSVQLSDRYHTLTVKKHGGDNSWHINEDTNLLILYKKYGPDWMKIAAKISGKNRTQVRHRYNAIQRYWEKGVSLYEIPRADKKDCNLAEKSLIQGLEPDSIKLSKKTDDKIQVDPIDYELRKYFQLMSGPPNPGRKRKFYGDDELDDLTRRTFAILNALSSNIVIPEKLGETSFTEKDKQLLKSLRNYKPMQSKVIDIPTRPIHYGRIFGTARGDNDGEKHFTALCSGNCNRAIKSRWHEGIDYKPKLPDDHCQTKLKMKIDTPEMVITFIGEEKNLEFEKMVRIFISRKTESCHSNIPEEIILPRPRVLSENVSKDQEEENGTLDLLQVNRSIDKKRKSALMRDRECNYTTSDGLIRRMNDSINCIEPNYHTLLGLQRIIFKEKTRSNTDNTETVNTASKEGIKSMEILKERLLQLFKYPIGLSRVLREEICSDKNVHGTETSDDSVVDITDDECPEISSPRVKRKKRA